jgi:hypothetical protein
MIIYSQTKMFMIFLIIKKLYNNLKKKIKMKLILMRVLKMIIKLLIINYNNLFKLIKHLVMI